MSTIVFTKLQAELAKLGIDTSQQAGSNVKKAFTGGKSTSTKTGLLAAERDTGGNFATVLDIFKNDAKYIGTMNDVEQMAFLNNIMDYNEFGGKSIKTSEGIRALDEAKNLTNESSDLKTSIDELLNKAKSMKDEAELNVNKAYKDLDDFFETGGDPFKKKNDKFLGGSMSEEGQIRTGIRQFLQKELKNGRIKLDEKDTARVLKYFPTIEDDPILVFKKIYGDEAYKKAGSFPGAFNIGEDYNHYEKIFRENMGEDILKVKDKKYVGDGKLLLTEAEEVFTPSKFDDDIPYAKGGRASFAGGKFIDEIVLMITKKEPMDAMKEVNKIIGKKGKYKNLTQEDIDRIVDQTNDHIFQRDPDNLFVGDRDIDNKKRLLTDDEIRDYEAELGDSETWMMDGTVEEAEKALKNNKDYEAAMKKEYDAASPAEREEVIGSKEPVEDRPMFKQETNDIKLGDEITSENFGKSQFAPKKKTLPEIDDKLLKNYNKEIKEGVESIMSDTSPEGLAKSIEIDNLMLKYPGMDRNLADQIASSSPIMKADIIAKVEQTFELSKQGKSGDEIIDIFKKETDRTKQADGGITRLRNGYYGGGQAMVEPDLSDIGHGSDALMSRTRMTAPGSQSTTSTGLNYLLGEDNDNIRVPFNEGLLVPPKKPVPPANPFNELMRIYKTYEEAMPGVSKDTKVFLQNDFKEKLNNAKISVEEFMTYRMQKSFADGGRIGYDQGGSSKPMGPEFSTNDPKAALREIIKRFIPIRDNPIPLLGNSQLMFNGLDNVQAGGQLDLFGGELNYGLKKSLMDDKFGLGFEFKKSFADGGIAGLRQGYAGGGGIDIARRGFLKFLGGTAAGVAALKTGLVKMFGKESGAISKKAIDEVIIEGGSGAPAWLQPLVNKALREGTDISKQAIKDGQVVKSLDTPTGKVDVYYDTRTGEIDIDYIGGNTALGESVNMRYVPGVADEGTKGVKPLDEFEAVESVPEGQMYAPDDFQVEFGENATSNVKDLYSDTSELATLGGQKPLIKDISETIKKKKVLKQMNENPDQFVSDNLPDYDPT